MDARYFKEQILDELEDAKCYVKNAVEIKAMDAEWGKMFLEMSASELDHAAKLWKMFEKYYKIMSDTYKNGVPEYIEEMHKEVAQEYPEKVAKVKYMHEMYNK